MRNRSKLERARASAAKNIDALIVDWASQGGQSCSWRVGRASQNTKTRSRRVDRASQGDLLRMWREWAFYGNFVVVQSNQIEPASALLSAQSSLIEPANAPKAARSSLGT